MKKLQVFLAILVLPALLVTSDLRPISTTREAHAAEESGVFKISATRVTSVQPGCPGCPESEMLMPWYEGVNLPSLAGSVEIDTNRQSSWSSGVTTTIDGGCAITSTRGLKCWGDNKYGQLGNGTSTASTTPVDAVGISNVTDVAAGATRTCVVANGLIRCVGNFWWPDLEVKKISRNTTTDSFDGSGNVVSSVQVPSWRCEIRLNGVLQSTVSHTSSLALENGAGCNDLSWRSLSDSGQLITDAAEVFLYGDSENWQSETPTVCYRSTAGRLRCGTFASPSLWTSDSSTSDRFECGGASSDDFESGDASGCTYPYLRRNTSDQLLTRTGPAAFSWEDSGMRGVVDADVGSSQYGGLGTICGATGSSARCATYNPIAEPGSRFGTISDIQGITAAEKVFITTFGNSGLCVYGAGLLSCGNGYWANGSYTFPTEVTATGFVETPLSIVYRELSIAGYGLTNLYIVTDSGVLSTGTWAFSSCTNCYTATNSLNPITAFKDATTSTYFVATGISGATDSTDLIPLSYETGARDTLSSKGITIKTAGGVPISGAKVTWTAPDIPGTLRSSPSLSNNTTNENGFVRFFGLRSGPVMLTISGGTASNSYLQAAIITVTLRPDEAAVALVPNPGNVINRTIRVQLPDGTSVPNAVITLRNNYLQYHYANSGSASSSWSARASEANLFNAVSCIYCYVPPPTYITGADGSVTFPSYVPTNRSTTYDLGILYDDTVINQTLLCRVTPSPCLVTQEDQTFRLGFMATVQPKVSDQDPSTPNQVDVVPGADGAVQIPLEMGDRDGPLQDSTVEAEDVCGTLLNGGLWSGSNSRSMSGSTGPGGVPIGTTGSTTCATSVTNPISTSPTTVVRPAGVSAFSSCSRNTKANTDVFGRATLTLCPTESGFFRIRGLGALPSREICVKVNGVECSRTAGTLTASPGSQATPSLGVPTTLPFASMFPTTTMAPRQTWSMYSYGGDSPTKPLPPLVLKRSGRTSTSLVLKRFPKRAFGGPITVTAVGACKITGRVIVGGAKRGTCKVTVAQAGTSRSKAFKRTYTLRIT